MNLIAGTVLQKGKYIIAEVLGQGGFGTTYRATHAYLGQSVVLKTLNESLRQHVEFNKFQQQFIAEAQRLAKCAHPNIVKVLDFFEEAGLSFIVMEYIPGQTLAELIKSGQPLPETKAVHYLRQIAEALSLVHQNGLLHRDVKPQNIMRRHGSDFVVLIDFGIAREFTPDTTQTHTGLLSEGYAPIEQYLPQGKRSPATDIYALAATLYCLLTGRAPIAAPLRDRISLVSPRQLQPSLSFAVEQAIVAGMAMEASDRPQSIEQWLALLPTPVLSETGNSVRSTPDVTHTSATLPILDGRNNSKLRNRPVTPSSPPPANFPPSTPPASIPSSASAGFVLPKQWLPLAIVSTIAIAIVMGATGFVIARNLRLGAPSPANIPDQTFPPRPLPSVSPSPEASESDSNPVPAPAEPEPSGASDYEPNYNSNPDYYYEPAPETPTEEYPAENYTEPEPAYEEVIPEPEPLAPEPPAPEATTPPAPEPSPESVIPPLPSPLPPAPSEVIEPLPPSEPAPAL